jgi:integrase/recombinase XerD
MDAEETVRYKFFLGTGCREREVSFASWQDINWGKCEYHIRRKDDVGFTPKSHESRTVPMPKSLVALLKNRRSNAPHDRWIFVNRDSRPDGHFLRKLKSIAKRAGLNCGQCKTKITVGRYEKRQVEVSCKDQPVCSHFYLHRFRKTCATRWVEAGIPVRTVQAWLGHKNLQTTMIYLGVTDSTKLRGQIDSAFGD